MKGSQQKGQLSKGQQRAKTFRPR